MGVQGLWDVLSKARQSRSLAHLAVIDGFETNTSGRRAYRVGIDASIWYQHAMHIPKKGANPELRLLFFRLLKLAELPFIPLFVFDGRERPQMKRGSKKGKSGSHALTSEFKKLLDVFGMEWRMALGEAEAELAYLNRVSVIDAVLTDDVDTLIFGAKTIMRNASLNLTGNRANPATNANGKRSEYHVMTFSSESIRTHPDIQMSRGGLILFALVSGGDYDNGLKNFGPQIAHCLARLGFGDQLLRQYEQCQGQGMEAFLTRWRADMNTELHTNAHNLLRSKMPALSVPPTFPDMNVLRYYINPVCSVSAGRQGGGNLRDSGELSIPRIATFCEDHFDEWGYRSAIIKRFRDIMWNAAVMRVLRRAALEADEKEATKRIAAGRTDTTIRGPLEPPVAEEVGTTACLIKKYLCPTEVDRRAAAFVRRDDPPPHKPETLSDNNPLIRKIVGTRRHVSTDNILEYRVEIDPTQLVRLAELGIKGKHREPQGGHRDENVPDYDDLLPVSSQGGSQPKKAGPKNPPPEPCSVMRSWVAASIMRQVHPRLVKEFESAEAAKQARKIGGKRKRQDDSEVEGGSEVEEARIAPPAPTPSQRAKASVPALAHRTIQQNRDLPSTATRGARPARMKIDVRAESSLPLRNCGFIFTFPDPDSPDMLAAEDEENAGIMVDLDADNEPPQLSQHVSRPGIASQPSTSAGPSSTRARTSRESPQERPRAGSMESSEEDDYNSDVHDDGVQNWRNAMVDGALSQRNPSASKSRVASASTRGKGKGKAPPARRPRASAPAASARRSSLDAVSAAFIDNMQADDAAPDEDDPNDRNAWMDALLLPRGMGKAPARGRMGRPRASATRGRPARGANPRRGTTHVPAPRSRNERSASPPPRPRAARARASTPPPPVRVSQPMPLPSPLGARAHASGSSQPAQRRVTAPVPLFLPSPSPPPPLSGRKRARSFHNDDVIEIESSDDERLSLSAPAPKRRPRPHRAIEPSSSQPSRLSDNDYLRDAEMVIDLT